MTQLFYPDFLDYVKEWVVNKQTDIANMWPQKGGWEKWAQAEIINFILKKDSTFDILPEQHVYTPPLKAADFLLNNSSSVTDKVVVENRVGKR